MSELQFNVNGQGAPVAPTSEGINVSVTPAITTTSLGISTDSSVSQSDQSNTQEVDAGTPVLPFPIIFQFLQNNEYQANINDKTIDPDSFVRLLKSNLAALGSEILSSWIESQQKQIDEENKKAARPDEIRKREERSNIADAAVNNNVSVDAKDSIVPFITVGLIFSAGGVKDAMFVDTMSTALVGVNPTSNQAPAVHNYLSDMRAELGLLGAALLQGAAYLVVAQSAVENGGKTPGDPKTTAKSYAEQILTMVSSQQLDNIIKDLVINKSDPNTPIDQKLIATLQAQIKAILLSSALVALFTSQNESGTGWITPEEFKGLLSGENETFGPNKETMDKILNQLNSLFASLPDKGAALKEGLSSFFGQNPSLDVLTNPAKVLAGIQPFFKRSATQVPI